MGQGPLNHQRDSIPQGSPALGMGEPGRKGGPCICGLLVLFVCLFVCLFFMQLVLNTLCKQVAPCLVLEEGPYTVV